MTSVQNNWGEYGSKAARLAWSVPQYLGFGRQMRLERRKMGADVCGGGGKVDPAGGGEDGKGEDVA